MALETHIKLFVTAACFEKKNCLKNGPKIGVFFNLLKNFVVILSEFGLFFQNLVICSLPSQNQGFGKNLAPEIWAKMLLVNQIARFLNQLYR